VVGHHELNEEKEYELATIDMFTFGAGYLELKEGKLIRFIFLSFCGICWRRSSKNRERSKDAGSRDGSMKKKKRYIIIHESRN